MELFNRDKLLEILQEQLNRQIEICNLKYENAMKIERENSASLDINSRTKKENTDLKEYNACVNAISNTVVKILAVNKAQCLNDGQEHINIEEELV